MARVSYRDKAFSCQPDGADCWVCRPLHRTTLSADAVSSEVLPWPRAMMFTPVAVVCIARASVSAESPRQTRIRNALTRFHSSARSAPVRINHVVDVFIWTAAQYLMISTARFRQRLPVLMVMASELCLAAHLFVASEAWAASSCFGRRLKSQPNGCGPHRQTCMATLACRRLPFALVRVGAGTSILRLMTPALPRGLFERASASSSRSACTIDFGLSFLAASSALRRPSSSARWRASSSSLRLAAASRSRRSFSSCSLRRSASFCACALPPRDA